MNVTQFFSACARGIQVNPAEVSVHVFNRYSAWVSDNGGILNDVRYDWWEQFCEHVGDRANTLGTMEWAALQVAVAL